MNYKNQFISIIVPVYNAEKRLVTCVESILLQSYRAFELILIDDGSTDASGEICDKLQAEDSRINVIHKQNGGVSSARNAGLEIAVGEYITFIDSDDYIDSDFLEKALTEIIKSDADFYISGILMETYCAEKLIKTDKYSIKASALLTVGELLEKMNTEYPMICICGPWCKLYKRELIEKNHIRFSEKLSLGEDTDFNLNYLSELKQIYFTSDVYYHYYRGNEGSLFSRLHKDTYEIHCLIYDRIRQMMVLYNCNRDTMQRFEGMYLQLIYGCIHSFFRNKNEVSRSEKIALIHKIEQNDYIRINKYTDISLKDKVLLYLIRKKMTQCVYFIFSLWYFK